MEDACCHFHTVKDIFFLGRAGKMEMTKANALRTELMMKRNAAKETKAVTSMACKKQREMNASRDYISCEIDVYKESDADFNLPKIHLMSHWVEQIPRYGAFQQFAAQRHEPRHEMNLEDG
jgi:hypothetical protein